MPSQDSDDSSTLMGSDRSDSEPQPLEERIPSSERVLSELRSVPYIKDLLESTNLSTNPDEMMGYILDATLWEDLNQALLKAITSCTSSNHKDVKKMIKRYEDMKEHIVQVYVPTLVSSLKTHIILPNEIDTSLLLQVIANFYIDKFQSLIEHSSSGEKQSIKEQVEKKISYATREDTQHLFSDAKVRKNVYYIIGFLGNQAEKEASRRAKDSGVSKCLHFLSQHCFLVRNRSDSESQQIDMLIADEDIPTDMISKREAFGGLHYHTKSCWQLFVVVDFVYSRVATHQRTLSS